MAIDALPFIAEKNYEDFRNIIKEGLPDTYDEWLKLQQQEVTARVRKGNVVRQIPVSPDAFEDFCYQRGRSGRVQLLLTFATEQAKPEPAIWQEDEE